VIESLGKLLAEPAVRARTAAVLARFGHASKPALPALREAAKKEPALEKAVREVEAARHPALLDPSLATDSAPARFVVRFATTKGDFDVEIHRDWAPIGVDRFWNLVRIGFYDGGRFFRVLPGFCAQFGKAGVPEVDKVWYPAKIKDDPVRESNRLGYLTFATNGKDARATQVFVNLADNTNLDEKGFAPIGRVVKGLDVVRALYGEYGEAPDQDLIHYEGDRYCVENFPNLDRITAATVVE
jgi:peptidyl-prolyl cis-trans isomerase A (cyclophilin A)